jgi:tubby-related protein 1
MPYDQQPSTGWAEAAPRPQPVNVPMAESSASTQGGGFVAPVLSSPAQKDDVRSFVTQPGPEGQEMVQCMLQRRKNHTYELFLRDESRNLEHGQFILATRKTQGKKSATYRVSSSRNDFEKRSPNYLGKIKASELTGAYTLVDTGKNPKKIDAWDKDDRGGASSGARQTLAEIHFSKPSDKRLPDLRNVKLGYNEGTEEQRLQTMPPQVDSHGKLTQDFNGRVRKISVKNFILEDAARPGRCVILFGRVSKDTFALDYCAPLSAMQAFAIAMTSFSELQRRFARGIPGLGGTLRSNDSDSD